MKRIKYSQAEKRKIGMYLAEEARARREDAAAEPARRAEAAAREAEFNREMDQILVEELAEIEAEKEGSQ